MKIGLLEFGHEPQRPPGHDAILKILVAAQRADELGFSRFWLTEHHEDVIAHGVPEVMTAIVATHTERIRVGCAGVLLAHACPLRIAKTFRLLQTLYPDRIDLGVAAGRAPANIAGAFVVPMPPSREDLYARTRNLANFVLGTQNFAINPAPVTPPELWILGSGGLASAQLAGELGASFGLSLFLSEKRPDAAVIDAYRESFQRSQWNGAPRWNVTVAGVCADTDAEAQSLLAKSRASGGAYSAAVVGSAAHCRDQLSDLANQYETDELIFGELALQFDQRLRSQELLAAMPTGTSESPDVANL